MDQLHCRPVQVDGHTHKEITMPNPPHRLLVLACTATKRPDLSPLPALQRYDGPSFRTLRRWRTLNPHDAERLDVLILSARLGLIAADALIEDYDQRMTQQQAVALQPAVSAALQQFLALRSPYAATLLHLGQGYLSALVPDLDNRMDSVQRADMVRAWLTGVAGPKLGILSLTEGGIGRRLGQLKSWLETTRD
jgi:Family of unknown function (DUF6884)